ncbi:MAG: hypothetical protein NVS3B12_23020 [Acidimicrobiales bacterium]
MGCVPFEATVADFADHVVVAVSGEVDLATADDLWAAIATVALERTHVLVDLTETAFMDSTGLSVLVRAHRHLASVDGSLAIRTAPGPVRRVLSISGLTRTLTVDPPDQPTPGHGQGT